MTEAFKTNDEGDNIFTTISNIKIAKMNELQLRLKNYNSGPKDLYEWSIFKDLTLNEDEKLAVEMGKYSVLVDRILLLFEHQYYNEVVLIIKSLLNGGTNIETLLDKNVRISGKSFKMLLYLYCLALIKTNKPTLCRPYIDLLALLINTFPDDLNISQDSIDTIYLLANAEG